MQDHAQIYYQGWLSKRSTNGGAFANWKKRYIVLKRSHVAWYKSDDIGEEPAGLMQLGARKSTGERAAGVAVVPQKKNTQLAIVADGRELLLEGTILQIERFRQAAEHAVAENRHSKDAGKIGTFGMPMPGPPPPAPLGADAEGGSTPGGRWRWAAAGASGPIGGPPAAPVPGAPPTPPMANPFGVPAAPATGEGAEGRSSAAMADALFGESRKSSQEALVDGLFGGSPGGGGGSVGGAAPTEPSGGASANPFGAPPTANPFGEDASSNPFEEEVGAAPKEKRRQTPATLPSMPGRAPKGGKRLSTIPGMGEEEEEEEKD